MAGNKTALAWGTDNEYDLCNNFADVSIEKSRRKRIIEAIRREEEREGIYHPAHHEDKYDQWAENGRFSARALNF